MFLNSHNGNVVLRDISIRISGARSLRSLDARAYAYSVRNYFLFLKRHAQCTFMLAIQQGVRGTLPWSVY